MKRSNKRHSQLGFTLIELVVAGTIAAMVLMSVTFALAQLSKTRNIARERVEAFQRASMSIEALRRDIAAIIRTDDLFDTRFLLTTREASSRTGGHERSDLLMFNISLRPLHPVEYQGEGREYETQYRVEDDELGSALWRRRDMAPDERPDGGGLAEPIADGVVDKKAPQLGNVMLDVKNLNISDHTGRSLVKNVSFELRTGEILAVAGVQGNGQSELAEAIVGLQEHVHGSISLDGVDITKASVREALHSGIAFVPESREEDGLIASFSIEENLILDLHDLPPYAKGPVISQSVVSQEAVKRVAEFDIRTQSAKDSASSLSGGNKQKVVLAR
ncbi:MAG: ATP-binding cassette domain-containing protein, partial [Planctomycetes bacterium]|nr:ATP-binding cassette domain-containing protein [Planctomycetota bacterium]